MLNARDNTVYLLAVPGIGAAISVAISNSYTDSCVIAPKRRPTRRAYLNGTAAIEDPLGNWSDQTGAYH